MVRGHRRHKVALLLKLLTAHVLAFAIAAAVIIAIPGPSVMFIVGRALA